MPSKLFRPTLSEPRQLTLALEFSSPAPAATNEPPSSPAPSLPYLAPTPETSPATPPLPSLPPEPPVSPVLAGTLRRIRLSDQLLEYRLLRSKRRTIGFLINDDGLRITAPRWVRIAEIENAILEKQRWILTKLAERQARSARRQQAKEPWQDGMSLPYLGAPLKLRLFEAPSVSVLHCTQHNELRVGLPGHAQEKHLKDSVRTWLQDQAHRLFTERLPLYSEKLGVQYRQFSLSSATTQWGACTVDGRIRLNWRLIHFALPQIDYVIAHELAHLKEMNHSARFWAIVESIFPDFRAARKVLRDHSQETLSIF